MADSAQGTLARLRALPSRVRALPPWVPDTALALALAALHLWVLIAAGSAGVGGPVLTAPALASVALGNLPLIARRRHPELVLTVIGFSLIATAALQLPAPGYGLLVAVYTLAAWRQTDSAGGTVAIIAGGTLLSLYLADAVRLIPLNALVLLSAWILGDRQRAQRLEVVELERRAAALEAERSSAAALATARERARIAREMHDVVAHGVMAMVAQASAAERLIPGAPERAAEALAEAESAGRASLGEVRRLLGLLRGDEEDAPVRGGVA